MRMHALCPSLPNAANELSQCPCISYDYVYEWIVIASNIA